MAEQYRVHRDGTVIPMGNGDRSRIVTWYDRETDSVAVQIAGFPRSAFVSSLDETGEVSTTLNLGYRELGDLVDALVQCRGQIRDGR